MPVGGDHPGRLREEWDIVDGEQSQDHHVPLYLRGEYHNTYLDLSNSLCKLCGMCKGSLYLYKNVGKAIPIYL